MKRESIGTLALLILLAASASRGQDPATEGGGAAVDSAAAPLDSAVAPVDSAAARAFNDIGTAASPSAPDRTESFVLLVKSLEDPLSTTYRVGDAQIRVWQSSASAIERAGVARTQQHDLIPLLARAASVPEQGDTGSGVGEGDIYILVRHPGARVAAWIEPTAPDELMLLVGEVRRMAELAKLGRVRDPAFRAKPVDADRTIALRARGVQALKLEDFPDAPRRIVAQAAERPYEFFAARPEHIADFRKSFPGREFYLDPGGDTWVQIEAWRAPTSE